MEAEGGAGDQTWVPTINIIGWTLVRPPHHAVVFTLDRVWLALVATRFIPGEPAQSRVFGTPEAAKAWVEWEIAQRGEHGGVGRKIALYQQFGDAITVEITDGSNRWTPSYHDLFEIIQALMEYERQKYPHLADPTDLPRRFFARCFDKGVTWADLQREFRLPDR